jgi:MFS family permease
MHTANSQPLLFAILLCVTAFFMPFAGPNITSTMYDVTEPEVRSTADAINSLIGCIGAASAPLIAGAVADAFSVGTAIIVLCSAAWLLCVAFLFAAIFLVPKDITDMHQKLEARAAEVKAG